jgi:hypothetical protein
MDATVARYRAHARMGGRRDHADIAALQSCMEVETYELLKFSGEGMLAG